MADRDGVFCRDRSGCRRRPLAGGRVGCRDLAHLSGVHAGGGNIFSAGVRRRLADRRSGRRAAHTLPLAGTKIGTRAPAVEPSKIGEGVMARIGFIGLGNMGLPMAQNLLKAGHQVEGVDVNPTAIEKLKAAGGVAVETAKGAAARADVVITMLPSGKEVREVYLGSSGIVENANPGTLLIDCSTIDVETARAVAAEAEQKGLLMLDAPVSGGVGGATAGTLTFMVGGSAQAFTRAESILQKMGKTIVHAGGAGNGQAAKICNNMILGVSMIAVSEAFVLAEKLGLDHQKLFDISSKSSGQCWSLTSYCPVPGPVPTSPANRDYQAGFTAAMMLKDLKLSQDAAKATRTKTELGANAERIYSQYVASGEAARDFSGIIRFVRG